jgi:hypothetical protein
MLVRFIFLFSFFTTYIFSQEFPKDWIGLYSGQMSLFPSNNLLLVELEISEIKEDSLWSYKMTYNSPNGEVVKDYQIRKKTNDRYVMDEGSIEIEMRFVENSFYDMYRLDSVIYTSVLRKNGKNKIDFTLYGGSIAQKNSTVSHEDSFFVFSYLPNFVQRVTLKRKRK